MQIDDDLLLRLEKLSHLKIDAAHREAITSQLTEIVSFVDNLAELDTTGIAETFAMTDVGTRLREDDPDGTPAVSDSILSNAPHSEDHFFIVPKIIE